MKFKTTILITLLLFVVLTISAASASEDVSTDNMTISDESQDVLEQSDDIASSDDELAKDNNEEIVGDDESGNSSNGTGYEEDPGDYEEFSYPSGSHMFTPSVQVTSKSNQYLQVYVYDGDGEWISNHKLIIKVWTGKTAKKYTIKTNLYGAAKFNTKKLKVGTHKVKILCPAESYFQKSTAITKIVVKKKIPVHAIKIKIKESKYNYGVSKSLKYGDQLRSLIEKSDNIVKITTENNNGAHFKIKKVKFFFKNKKTGKIKTVKVYKSKFNEHRCLATTKLLSGYTPYKAKVWVFKYRTH